MGMLDPTHRKVRDEWGTQLWRKVLLTPQSCLLTMPSDEIQEEEDKSALPSAGVPDDEASHLGPEG